MLIHQVLSAVPHWPEAKPLRGIYRKKLHEEREHVMRSAMFEVDANQREAFESINAQFGPR